MSNDYEKEIAEILSQISDTDKLLFDNIEEEINHGVKLLEMRTENGKKPFFTLEPLFNSPSYNQLRKKGHIGISIFVGDRNIGKSTSMLKYAFSRNKPFVVVRNRVSEIEALILMDPSFMKSETQGVKEIASGMYKIFNKETKDVICYLTALSSGGGKKSLPYNEIDLIIIDEFADGNIKNKFDILSKYITTVQRHKENFNIIMVGNYDNGGGDFLNKLGQQYKKEVDATVLDWISGTFIWNIKKGLFRAFKNKKNIGYRLSLKNKELWISQYGSGYSYVNENNILLTDNITEAKPVYHFVIDGEIFTLSICNNGKFCIFDDEKYTETETPYICFTNEDFLKKPEYQLVKVDKIKNIAKLWKEGRVYCANKEIRDFISVFLASCLSDKKKPRY